MQKIEDNPARKFFQMSFVWLVIFPLLCENWISTAFFAEARYFDEIFLSILTVTGVCTLLISKSEDSRLHRALAAIVFAFVFGACYAFLSGQPLEVMVQGFWDLWRSHLAILAGLALASVIRPKSMAPIVVMLRINALVALFQLVAGEAVLAGWFQAHVEYRSGILRTFGLIGHPNFNAAFITLLVFLEFRSLLEKRTPFLTFAIPLWLVALFSTGSRAIFFLAIPALLYIAHQAAVNLDTVIAKARKTALPAVVLVLFLTVGGMLYLNFQERESSTHTYTLIPSLEVITAADDPVAGYFRAYALIQVARRFVENPVTGLGYGYYGTPTSYRILSEYLAQDKLNEYGVLEFKQLDMLSPVVLAESGLVGLVLWCLGWWYLLREMFSRLSGMALQAVIASWVVIMLALTFVGPGVTHPIVTLFIPVLFIFRQAEFERSQASDAVASDKNSASDPT